MAIEKTSDKGNIRVADITLAQLSRGLYRSTATAFKELVNNAYDADATVVRIDTNYPEFNFISCVDNGTGMPLEEFLRYFKEEGIGSCIKRKHMKDTTAIYGRPIIGRLGIGMLAIGQLCHSFKIESHYKDRQEKGKAYQAEIVLSDVAFPFDDKEKVLRDNNLSHTEMDVGTWNYKEIDYVEKKRGFRIYSSDVRNTFKREMKNSIQKEMSNKERANITFSQPDLHVRFYDKSKSIRDCKAYLETIWELSILCPLPYYGKIEKYPVNVSTFTQQETKSAEFKKAIKFIKDRQSTLISHNFSVIFDGIELRRHIQLPTARKTIPKLYFVKFDNAIFGSRLKFSGYLFGQASTAIRPLELNGVQIRLRGVGIGGYDSTFLKYYKEIETIRSRWVSGEIFVDEGLESALNIDRDSFNEHDEHFKKLQSVFHKELDTVFNEINAIARGRSEEKRDEKENKLTQRIQTIVAKESKGKFKLLRRDLEKDAPIVTVNENKGEIILNTSSRPLKRKKADMIIRSIMLAYHTAERTTRTEEERGEKFYQLVIEILGDLL
jgi:hypothetical protein